MFTLRLPNGQEFPINYTILKELVENLPEENDYTSYRILKELAEIISDDAEYNELADALLKLGITSITKEVIENTILTEAQYDALWENGNQDIRRCLVRETHFLQNLSDAQARDILATDDLPMLLKVARHAELFYPDDEDADQAARLSGDMADALLEHISKHQDARVRHTLMRNDSLPAKFYPPVRLYLEEGMSNFIPLVNMGRDDMGALTHASLDSLVYIAENITEIRDKTIRREVAKALVDHPDPAIRFALAENDDAPEYALKWLLKDRDADIAATAQKELDRREEDEEEEEED